MASLRQLKEKKQSVNSINKITSAMQMISIAKSKVAVNALNQSKNYQHELEQIIESIFSNIKLKDKYEKTTWILITSDFGLVGGYNGNINRLFHGQYKEGDKVIVFGNKGKSLNNSRIEKDIEYYSITEIKTENKLDLILAKIVNDYTEEKRNIKVAYTKYENQISFTPSIKQILPVVIKPQENKVMNQIEFEPNAESIMQEILGIYLYSTLIYHYKEANASENTSRRVAMENATNNSDEILKNLQIEFNKKRQAKITQELIEIQGGSEALK